ncbi:NUDIX hydrolase [Actinoplanes sp. NPDC026670]|uniref:NUDIX hydrolase n=1 Tax=Actinoplanes sp. NPDC026670 TaxID=3154700 RepID=UPI0033CEB669
MNASEIPPMATPRVAAGALFFDDDGRVLLVKPSYKDGWDIPGGYVEPGESPRAACIREVREELGITTEIRRHLVVDWAPAEAEGDKILFVFDGGIMLEEVQREITLDSDELDQWRFVTISDLGQHLPARLSRRIQTAVRARSRNEASYAEHGIEPA